MKVMSTHRICLRASHHHASYSQARACLEWSAAVRPNPPRLVTEPAELPRFYELFTFGLSQRHPITGESLSDRCVIWEGAGDLPRALQFQRFGPDWAFHYGPNKAPALLAEYGYRPLTGQEMPDIRILSDKILQTWVDDTIARYM